MADVQQTGCRDELLTADEVARLLAVRAKWVYTQSQRHRIPTITLGRHRRYRRCAIFEWPARLEDGAYAEYAEPGLAKEPGALRVAAVVAST
jgi:excisionase family DNA binding protein